MGGGTVHRESTAAIAPQGPHRDDVLLGKLLRVRARLGLIHHDKSIRLSLPSELRLLDECIEELTNDA